MRKRVKTIIALSILLILALSLGLVWGIVSGVIRLQSPSRAAYPCRGVDVSHYQGNIDCPVLAENEIDFAYIKATEGSTHTDERFAVNFAAALETRLMVGAYHFFSADSPGRAQAEHFLAATDRRSGVLIPMVDVELSASADAEAVRRELGDFIAAVRDAYGRPPAIYTTTKNYRLFIAGYFKDCPIWIRSVYFKPLLADGRDWTIWQYTDKEKLAGYIGEETFIDMNVFYATRERMRAEMFIADNP